MVKVIPAILTNNPQVLKILITKAQSLGDRVQIDIIDGKFANNKTISPEALENIDTSLFIDYHLMVDEPIHWVEKAVRGQGDRLIGQVEKMTSQLDFIKKVGEVGLSVGLAVDLPTPISIIEESTLPDLDVVLLMSVPAGFGGQKFDTSVFAKIKKLSEIRSEKGLSFKICIDGGVTKYLIPNLEKLGSDEVAIGRSLLAP